MKDAKNYFSNCNRSELLLASYMLNTKVKIFSSTVDPKPITLAGMSVELGVGVEAEGERTFHSLFPLFSTPDLL